MAGHGGGVGRAAGAAAARAGRALATRLVAAKATLGTSLAIEIKMILLGIAFVLIAALLTLVALVFVGAGQASADPGSLSCSASPLGQQRIPERFMPIYGQAAARFGLGERGTWVLASIHAQETNFGDGRAISSAGALGPMQFMPTTWIRGGRSGDRIVVPPTTENHQGYATDGDGDGMADTNNVHDAIHSAARYLKANGAPGNWQRAIFAYNHADWYVDEVQTRADQFQGTCTMTGGGGAPVAIGDLNFNDTSGEWGGAMKFAKALADLGRRHGCTSVSEKRSTRNTASGGVSDHWTGSTTAYAVDIANCSLTYPDGPLDRTAAEIAQVLGMRSRVGVQNVIRGRYRFQMLWQTNRGGNHYNHVHIGVRLV
jgi:transglycosylase-like protein with SLT domain